MKPKSSLLGTLLLFVGISYAFAQSPDDASSMFVFGHSLIHHENQVNPTPSQETSVPHWLHFLVQEAGKQYNISGQYGFLTTHINLPPIAQWGFDFAPSAWESDYETFAQANFSDVLITPANFIQWQGPSENFYGKSFSPIDATNTMIDWCHEQTPFINYYVYENWPDMAPFLNADFPPSNSEWIAYNEYLQNDFSDWFDGYFEGITANQQDRCVKMIPVGRLISKALQTSPYDQINITDLYEDNAPHGRPTIYFMAAMITYMAIYEEITPVSYQVSNFIEPIVRNNYATLSEFFWNELLAFNIQNGDSKVFCNTISSTTDQDTETITFEFYPNPTTDNIYFRNLNQKVNISVRDATGKTLLNQTIDNESNPLDLSGLLSGMYFIEINTINNNYKQHFKIIKT